MPKLRRARAKASSSQARALRWVLQPAVLLSAGGLVAALWLGWTAGTFPSWSAANYQEALKSTTTAKVTDVIADQEWAGLNVLLPNGKHTVVQVEPGREFGDSVPVYRNGDQWLPGPPNDDHAFALLIGVMILGVALAGPAFMGWYLIEEYLAPRVPYRSRGHYYYD